MQETLYSAARDAINNRVKLRDNVLIFYLAAIYLARPSEPM